MPYGGRLWKSPFSDVHISVVRGAWIKKVTKIALSVEVIALRELGSSDNDEI